MLSSVERIFALSERKVRDIMTPRHEIKWIDNLDSRETMLRAVRACHHAQVVVSRGQVDDVVGFVRKQDLLDQVLGAKQPDIPTATQPPKAVHEIMGLLAMLDMLQRSPVRMAIVVDEHGSLQGIVTQSDLLEAIAGDMPELGEMCFGALAPRARPAGRGIQQAYGME